MQKILNLKGRVIVDVDLHKLADQISKLTEAIDQISLENRKLRSELVITQNVNDSLDSFAAGRAFMPTQENKKKILGN